jgi:hypothetical protein
MRKIRNFTFVLIIILVSSSVLWAQNASEKAKTLIPKTDKSLVYIIRPSSIAFAVRLPVDVDKKPIATLGAKNFGFINLDPGKHLFKVVNGTSKASLFDLDTEAGKVYYFVIEMKMGTVNGRGVLKLVEEDAGIKSLKNCDLAKNNQEQL